MGTEGRWRWKVDEDEGWMGMEVIQGRPVQVVGPSWETGCCAHSKMLGLGVAQPREAAELPRKPQPGSG